MCLVYLDVYNLVLNYKFLTYYIKKKKYVFKKKNNNFDPDILFDLRLFGSELSAINQSYRSVASVCSWVLNEFPCESWTLMTLILQHISSGFIIFCILCLKLPSVEQIFVLHRPGWIRWRHCEAPSSSFHPTWDWSTRDLWGPSFYQTED